MLPKPLTKLALAVFFSMLFFTWSISVFAVGVRPLVIDVDCKPGDKKSFELILTPANTQEIINLSLYQPVQLTTGGLTYQLADPQTYRAIQWVKLEKDTVTIPPGEETKVKGTVSVPFDAGGSHTVVVMVEPKAEEVTTGIGFRVRYAVRININVERPGLRAKADVTELSINEDDKGMSTIKAVLKNPSPLYYDASAEVTIRDEGRRLVERVPLKTQLAWQSNHDTTRVYPGAEVWLIGSMNEPLVPGKYEMRLFLRYADGLQIIQTKEFTVDQSAAKAAPLVKSVKVTPDSIEENIKPGGVASKVIQIDNRTGDQYQVKLAPRDIESQYSHSLFSTFDVQLRGDSEFDLEAHRSGRVIFTFKAPRDLQPGGYYGILDVGVFANDELVERHEVDLSFVADGKFDYQAEILGVSYELYNNELLFSVDVRNQSEIHFAPKGTLYLKNQQGEVVKTVQLKLQEGTDNILPQRVGRLVATTTDVKPGEYTADIRVIYESAEIGMAEKALTIEPAGGVTP